MLLEHRVMVVVVVTDANMVACGLSPDGREAFKGFGACDVGG